MMLAEELDATERRMGLMQVSFAPQQEKPHFLALSQTHLPFEQLSPDRQQPRPHGFLHLQVTESLSPGGPHVCVSELQQPVDVLILQQKWYGVYPSPPVGQQPRSLQRV